MWLALLWLTVRQADCFVWLLRVAPCLLELRNQDPFFSRGYRVISKSKRESQSSKPEI